MLSESNHLGGSHQVAAPVSNNSKMDRITQLSGNTVVSMCEKPAQKIFNDGKYVLQVLQFKEIDTT